MFSKLRPAVSSEISTLTRLRIRNTLPRWATIARRLIRNKKRSDTREKFPLQEGDSALVGPTETEGKTQMEKENVECKSTEHKVCCAFSTFQNWFTYILWFTPAQPQPSLPHPHPTLTPTPQPSLLHLTPTPTPHFHTPPLTPTPPLSLILTLTPTPHPSLLHPNPPTPSPTPLTP